MYRRHRNYNDPFDSIIFVLFILFLVFLFIVYIVLPFLGIVIGVALLVMSAFALAGATRGSWRGGKNFRAAYIDARASASKREEEREFPPPTNRFFLV